jgi:hypothetical protein
VGHFACCVRAAVPMTGAICISKTGEQSAAERWILGTCVLMADDCLWRNCHDISAVSEYRPHKVVMSWDETTCEG